MKLKTILTASGLALALGFGVFAGLNTNKNYAEAKAYSTSGLTLVTSSNLSTYDGYDAVILSAKAGSPDFQLGWDGSSLFISSAENLVVYTIGSVSGGQYGIYFEDTNHYLGYEGVKGFNKTTPLKFEFGSSGQIERPERLIDDGNGGMSLQQGLYLGWFNPDGGGAPSYYFDQYEQAFMGGTYGYFYLYAITDPDLVTATNFAQTLLTNTNGICKDTSSSPIDTDVGTLAAAWNSNGNDKLVDKWNALSSDAQTIFVTGTANATLSEAKARYIHIMSRYSGTLTAFEGGPSYASVNYLVPAQEAVNTNMIVIIAIVSSFVLALGTMFILKKRHN